MEPSDSPSSSDAQSSLLAIVTGRVQGVGFRFFVVRCAAELGLTGRTRNLFDGSVEVQARGPRGRIDRFVEQLRQGPPLSRVTGVELQWDVPLPEYQDFDIAY